MKFSVFLSSLVFLSISSLEYAGTQIALPMPMPMPFPGMAYPTAGHAPEDDYDEIAYATEAMTMGTKERAHVLPQVRFENGMSGEYQTTKEFRCHEPENHTSTFIPGGGLYYTMGPIEPEETEKPENPEKPAEN